MNDLEFGSSVAQYVSIALDREESERRLREVHGQIEARVEERTVQLKDTFSQLERFSYTVAHDLRAPFRTMRGYAEVLLEELAKMLTPPQRQHLAKIRIAATGLELRISDLLEFSRISRQELEFAGIKPGRTYQ